MILGCEYRRGWISTCSSAALAPIRSDPVTRDESQQVIPAPTASEVSTRTTSAKIDSPSRCCAAAESTTVSGTPSSV